MVYSNYIPLIDYVPLHSHYINTKSVGFTIMSPIMVVYNKGFPDYTTILYVYIYPSSRLAIVPLFHELYPINKSVHSYISHYIPIT